jgi:hypothetical protein
MWPIDWDRGPPVTPRAPPASNDWITDVSPPGSASGCRVRGLRPYLALMQQAVRRTLNLRKAPTPKPAPPTTPPAQGFLAPNLASRNAAPTTPDDDLPEDFRKALDAVSDDEE